MKKYKSVYETDNFKSLQNEWYQKLKDSKFEDSEGFNNSSIIQPQIFQGSTTGYADLCTEILKNYKFKKDIHKAIFQLHADGKTEVEITKHVKQYYGFDFSRRGINDLLTRVKKEYSGK